MTPHKSGLTPEAEQVVQQLVAKHGQALDAAARAKFETMLRNASERLGVKLELCNATELTRVGRAADAVASLPPVVADQELATLRAQVQEAHAAVMHRQQAVPTSICDHMRQLLEGARPSANVSPLPDGSVEEPSSMQLSPAPQQLQALLAGALPHMPELRARLSEAVARLERVTAATATAVELAPASPAKNQPQQAAGTKRPAVSPAFEEALRSGKIGTRRRLRDRLSDTAQRNLASQIAEQ